MKKIKNITLGTTVGILATLSTSGVAQEQASGGALMTLGVSQRLSYSTDTDPAQDNALTATTGLNFGYTSETKIDLFSFNVASGLEFDTDSQEFGLADPTVSLAYKQDAKDSGILATVGYQETDISDSFNIVAGEDTFVVLDEGTRVDFGVRLVYDFGRTNRVSGSIEVAHNSVEYHDTTSPELTNQNVTNIAGTLNFQADDRILTTVSSQYSLTEAEDGTETRDFSVGTGVSLAFSKRLTVTAGVQFDDIEQSNGSLSVSSQGFGYSGSANYEMPDGAITASLASSFDEDGRTFTSNIGRQMTLKAGELSYSFGLSGSDNGDLNPLYAVSYSQELPRDAAANVRLSQSFATNGTGREAVNTTLSAGYQQPLTPVSDISATFQ